MKNNDAGVHQKTSGTLYVNGVHAGVFLFSERIINDDWILLTKTPKSDLVQVKLPYMVRDNFVKHMILYKA